ncbi:cell division protein ZapA [Crocinitomix catalasitica]|uniref:cell division protein ZapA n=1 Tax=Crocinitomix catalasitica TaxID=184607 RepID=UPI000485BE5C|nr:cell division protein ZapA [Crocinitomix catalasitica]
MMDKIALKVIIAGRTYPLTIKTEEEEAIRKAADRINSNIKKLQGSYAVKDMQDLLAMTALQIALQAKPDAGQQDQELHQVNQDIKSIIDKIDEVL